VPGTARLDRAWWPNIRVNDDLTEEKWYPRLSFIPEGTAGLTTTRFLAVWQDSRHAEHCPDIYFSYSDDGGKTWKPNVMIENACDPDDPPYPDCACLYTPDLTVRKADERVWVVWQQDPSYNDTGGDNGDIYYANGAPDGSSWTSAAPVYEGDGDQILPRIAPHGRSGYLYVVWEDERDDGGDIYISRYDGSGWSDPVKVSDDTTGAEQRTPAVIADDPGNVYVIWEDARDDYDGEIFFSRWLTGTAWGTGTWSANVKLSDPTADMAKYPDIAVGPGALFAAWVERKSGYFNLVVARSTDQGANWERFVVDSVYYQTPSGDFVSYKYPAISSDPMGRVYVTWLQAQGTDSRILFSLSPDGGQHWSKPRTLDYGSSLSEDTAPAIAVSFDGKTAVAWHDRRDDPNNPQIYATGYPADSYLPAGQYVRTFDAHGPVSWGTITWTASISPGTGLQIATCVMTAPGAPCSPWHTYSHPGESIPHTSGQIIRYRATFTSTGGATAVLDEVIISYEQYRVFLPLMLKQ
ncbi:MAG TPA: exo-alpha-sialidase, partial [Chloroflexi bacterium]|nr:exo-alpha-sialidase [Chloroflexota bacterium]